MRGAVISLCDFTTTFLLPWAELGFPCYAVDIQHEPGEHVDPDTGVIRVGADIMDWKPPEPVAFVAAFPPCTHLSGSGARWWLGKEVAVLSEIHPGESDTQLRGRVMAGETPVFDGAMALLDRCRDIAEASGAPWFIEQPVGRATQVWPDPDHRFHPYEYGGYDGGHDDGYTKKTNLWVGGGFVMPERKPIELDPHTHDRIHKAAPSPERANFRSATPAGFARAVFEANLLGAVRASGR